MATTPGNALDLTGSAGIVLFDGTSATTTTAPTNHNVMVGTGSNSITSVAPSATSGIPLVSNGASADPSFTTAVVPGGGTGDTSFTAFSVITGGTTSTGALQNVSGVGTSGQVLSSNGAGALPTWQTAPTGVFAPNSTVNYFDDFIGFVLTNSGAGQWGGNLSWSQIASANIFSQSNGVSDNGHPGSIGNASTASGCTLQLVNIVNQATGCINLGGGALTINWIIKLATLSNSTNRYTLRIGLGDTSQADQVNGLYFEYSDNENTGKWVYKSANASTRTTTNSATTVTSGYHNLQISINAAGTSASFSVDGVSLGAAITTNIPTSNPITAIVDFVVSVGTVATSSILLDLMFITQTLTSAR